MITGKTKITGIFGDPIEHTLSPLMHNAAFNELGLNYCYVPFHVKAERLKQAVEAIKALNIKGVNITVPHKERVIKYLDEISEEAKYIGAVNTILNEKDKLKGFNTDAYGFVRALKEKNINLNNKNVILLGAGGAARAIAYGILKEGANLSIFNRTLSKAYKIKDSFNFMGNVEVIEKIDSKIMLNFQIVVNATSLGLKKDDPMPIAPEYLRREHIVIDIVYPDTTLMREAEKIGCKVIGGLGMLLWQAAKSFEIWTKHSAPIEVMKGVLKNFNKK